MHDRQLWAQWALVCEGAELKAQAIISKRNTQRGRR